MQQQKWYRTLTWPTLLLAAYWLACFIATHLPKVPSAVEAVSDKTWHFVAYSILSVLLAWALSRRYRGVFYHSGVVMGIIAVYGVIDEVLQIPVGRHCDLHDWMADMIGAICGCAAFHIANGLWQWIIRPRPQP